MVEGSGEEYQAWKIETAASRTLTGLLTGTYPDASEHIDEKGNTFDVNAGGTADIRAAPGHARRPARRLHRSGDS